MRTMLRSAVLTLAALLALLEAHLCSPALPRAQAQERPGERRYAAGPLTAEEFKGAVPNPLPPGSNGQPLHATTQTELRYGYKYEFESKGGRTIMRTTEIDAYSSFLGDKSWLDRPDDKKLLAHEQVHFDITEIHARRTQLKMGKRMVEEGYYGAGATEAEARDELNKAMNKDFDVLLADMRAEQTLYDKETRHGTDPEAQSQWDRKTKAQLAELIKDLLVAAKKNPKIAPNLPNKKKK